jgi:thiosulfate/3-mercaptopyruvate sulfurtransferase
MLTTPTTTIARLSTNARRGLVDADWLEAHLDEPGLVVVEVDVNAAAHEAGHIPGAVLWNIYTDLKDGDYRLRSLPSMEELVQRSGIDADTTVVFYGYGPAIGAWLLRWCGHTSVALLDLGRDAWRDQGRPWTTESTAPTPSDYRLERTDDRVRAGSSEVIDGIGDPRVTVLDVRSRNEFDGERFWPSGGMEDGGRAGHVPGARHLPVDGLTSDDGSFRPTAELAERFADLDLANGPGEVITYCTIGARAATAWFVLTYLIGRNRVRVYDGSWAEWGRTAELPVECAPFVPSASRAQPSDSRRVMRGSSAPR